MTLVDPSAGMLAHSRALNPECEHVQGDMRDVRLGRTEAGFHARAVPFDHSELQPGTYVIFVARRPHS